MRTEFRDSDHAIIDACYATYQHGASMCYRYEYGIQHLPTSFPLIDHELGENDGHPRVRVRIWRGWWVCTAPKIKWWWLVSRVDETSLPEAINAAWSMTYMQR